jgi:hypothetical protein
MTVREQRRLAPNSGARANTPRTPLWVISAALAMSAKIAAAQRIDVEGQQRHNERDRRHRCLSGLPVMTALKIGAQSSTSSNLRIGEGMPIQVAQGGHDPRRGARRRLS